MAVSVSPSRWARSSARSAHAHRFFHERAADCTDPREVGVGQGEFTARRQGLEQGDGVPGATLGFLGTARTPEELREPSKRVALFELVAEHAAALQRLVKGGDPFVILIGQIALPGAAFQKLRARGGPEPLAEPQRTRILRGRLAMRTERCRPLRGGRDEAKHGVDVAGRVGMVREAGQIRAAARWLGERREGLAVQVDLPADGHRLLDGETGELMPERDPRGMT